MVFAAISSSEDLPAMTQKALDHLIERLGGLAPATALVLGSGLGNLVDRIDDPVRVSYADLPGFPRSGVTGHAGELVAGLFAGVPVLMLSGRAHYYEHGNAAAMRPALEVLAGIGITRLILTNAAGSVDPDMPPGSVMLINDHINFSGTNPLIGEPSDRRFVGLTGAYDAGMRAAIEQAARATGTTLHKGVYMWFSGPCFETPAEIRMARLMGANAVGMSTVPEVILARFLGLRVAACSVVTNLAAGMTGAELSHQETKDMAPVGGARLATILQRLFRDGLLEG
jgi:purine-nucleoside phosphorylase